VGAAERGRPRGGLEVCPGVGVRLPSWTGARAAVDNAVVPTWFRVLRPVGVGLGAAGVLAAVWHVFSRLGPNEVLSGLSWLGIGVVPLFTVGVWLACRRPEHPQARRLLMMGSALAVDVGLEGLIQDEVAPARRRIPAGAAEPCCTSSGWAPRWRAPPTS
jgi:hypothetical protein